MTSIDSFPEQNQELVDNSHIATEYFTFRVNVHILQGMTAREANIAVLHQSIHDPEFMESARNLEAYRATIAEGPYGISEEIFTYYIERNPGQVLADAKHWASIRKQLGNTSTS